MKKITLITFYLFLGTAAFAQSSADTITITSGNSARNATTENEYNFATVGYLRVLNEGADMKAGYTARPIINGTTDPGGVLTSSSRIDAVGLYRGADLRAIMLVHVVADKAKKIYCMPLYDAGTDLWLKFLKEVNASYEKPRLFETMARGWAWVLRK